MQYIQQKPKRRFYEKANAVFFILIAGTLHAQQLALEEVVKRTARGIEEVLPQRVLVYLKTTDDTIRVVNGELKMQ